MTASAAHVGFVGLGQIGGPMARRLVEWEGGLTVYDVAPEATAPFAERGVEVAADVATLAQRSDVVCVMVRDDDQVRSVISGAGGILAAARPGTVIAIHSTIGADTASEMAALGDAVGVDVVDAPVSGGAMGAHGGTLAVMVGGADAAVERCRGPFGCFASLVSHLGPVGAGTRAKLARNLLHFTSFVAVAEASRLAEAAGIDPAQLGEIVRHSDAVTGGPGAIMLRSTTEPMAADDPLRPIFEHTATLGHKDLSLALEVATELGCDLPLATAAASMLTAALGVTPVDDSP